MASQTLVQTHVAPSRPHDYLYDANYTVSSRKDHVKALLKSQTHDVMINPSFNNMFSSLRNYPSTQYTLRAHHLPLYLGQDRRPPNGTGQADVAGVDRFKFFRRPVVPYVPSLGGQVVYARRPAPVVARAREVRVEEGGVRTVAVQTIYRESEAQTDPYSPPYTLPPNTQPPELLALATLTFGAGLPAGLAELEMIERARAKRAWEASLPKVVDQESFEKRLRMMEEMELREWREREDEIRRLQNHRLEILKRVIARREQENEALNNERIEKMWQRKLQERDALLEKIQRKRVKLLRKLADKRAKVEQKIERRDIIADYANFSSKVYAPKARDGVFFDKPDTTLRLELEELDDYRGLTYLESTLPTSATAPNLTPPDTTKDQIRRNPLIRKELHLQSQLTLMDQKLKERKKQQQEDDRPLRFAQRIERPPERPGTPGVERPREEDEDMEVAAVLLQKIIRGRIAQNAMYQGEDDGLRHMVGKLGKGKGRKEGMMKKDESPRMAEEGLTRTAVFMLVELLGLDLSMVQYVLYGCARKRNAWRLSGGICQKPARATGTFNFPDHARAEGGNDIDPFRHLILTTGKERRLNLINELRTRVTIRRAQEAQGLVTPRAASAAARRAASAKKRSRPPTAEGRAAVESKRERDGAEGVAEARAEVEERRGEDVGERREEGEGIGGMVRWGEEEEADRREEVGMEEDEEFEEEEDIILPGTDPLPPSPSPPTPHALSSLHESTLSSLHISTTLDYLTKELTRLREERRISALVLLAERTRRMREAEESGRRQAEIKRQKVQDEVFRQVMRVHCESVETYLEDLVVGVVERESGVEARRRVREGVERLVGVGGVVEGRDQQAQTEQEDTIVADLVASFLIPEVEKQTLRSQVKDSQRRYLLAAHRTVVAELPKIEEAASSLVAGRSSTPTDARTSSRAGSRAGTPRASRPGSRRAG
ncbi:Cilia- and flagella-associated protein 91 [Rhizophlyctis rosea]|nr:Cilia- and flagella-associated protein 91 [Rhizophlyctis rosea]